MVKYFNSTPDQKNSSKVGILWWLIQTRAGEGKDKNSSSEYP